MRRHLAILLPALCMALAAGAQVPLHMDVETSEARTRYLDVFRGESVALELAFKSYGKPLAFTDGTPATIFWQTNGMAAAWWTAPATTTTNGLVSAAWTPAMDCGADRYALFVGVGDASRMYRASFQVRMRGAPGYPANPLPLPVEVLDFAAVAWTNAPWALLDDISNIVNRAYVEGLGIEAGTDGETITTIARAVVAGATNEVLRIAQSYADGVGHSVESEVRWINRDIALAADAATNYTDHATNVIAAVADFAMARVASIDSWLDVNAGLPTANAAAIAETANMFTNYVAMSKKELHADSYANIVWQNIYSNGWVFLVAVTNVLEFAE